MGIDYKESTVVPLLESSSPSSSSSSRRRTGTASSIQTLGNIIVSIVGTGILGLPFAFRIAGWFAGSVGVSLAGIATCYCMLLLVQCRDKQASQELTPETKTYGDLGYKCMGNYGRYLTEFLIFTAQCGGSVAYLVFIGQNLSSIFRSQGHGLSFSFFILLLIPIQIALSWIGSLSALAPFSIFADVCNVLAMAIVVKEDVEKVMNGEFKFSDRTAITSSIGGLPFAGGMAVFCFEGFGMTLALEASMTERDRFPSLLAKAFTGITLVYVLFGFFGYMAYGDQTRDIITLNLPHNWSSIAVQIGLCLGLMFTFPIMVHPIHEIVEGRLENCGWYQKMYYNDGAIATRVGNFGRYMSRAILITILAILADYYFGNLGIICSWVWCICFTCGEYRVCIDLICSTSNISLDIIRSKSEVLAENIGLLLCDMWIAICWLWYLQQHRWSLKQFWLEILLHFDGIMYLHGRSKTVHGRGILLEIDRRDSFR